MGSVYKNKPGGSCRMCKPYKHGWEDKKKWKHRKKLDLMKEEVEETINELVSDKDSI